MDTKEKAKTNVNKGDAVEEDPEIPCEPSVDDSHIGGLEEAIETPTGQDPSMGVHIPVSEEESEEADSTAQTKKGYKTKRVGLKKKNATE